MKEVSCKVLLYLKRSSLTASCEAIGRCDLVRAEKGFHNLLQRIMSSTLPASSKDDLMGV